MESGEKMYSAEQITIPKYLKIAVNISARIASGDFPEGEKLKGRSVLSTEYNVSPETIRRAMSILSDKQVVEVIPGSGIIVSSKENALQFLNDFKEDESVNQMRNRLSQLFDQSKELNEKISGLTSQVIEMFQYRRSDLVTPVEVRLPKHSHIIGKSIGNLEIWNHTGATIIGIIQNRNIIISPGPYYEFDEDDKVLIVGDENVIERFNAYINKNTKDSL